MPAVLRLQADGSPCGLPRAAVSHPSDAGASPSFGDVTGQDGKSAPRISSPGPSCLQAEIIIRRAALALATPGLGSAVGVGVQ